jgi:hypothetical protein
MKVYWIKDSDWDPRIVEAPDFAKAVAAWRAFVIADLKASGDYDEEDGDDSQEPESVELISDEPVIHWSEPCTGVPPGTSTSA